MQADNKIILKKKQIAEIFCYLDVILKCHVQLLRELEARTESWDIKPDIGDIFLERVRVAIDSFPDNMFQVSFIKLYKVKTVRPCQSQSSIMSITMMLPYGLWRN